ncbi:MAG: glycosyltransferase [Myxococcota bacterium]
MEPLVSVLLPYRDAVGTLGVALESVLAEREVPLELVAVDDGSTDGGAALVEAWARKDARVVPVRGAGRGIAEALALAARAARAPLLARMDADDRTLPGRFAAQVAHLRRNPSLGVVGTRVEPFPAGAAGDGLRRYIAWQNDLVDPDDHDRDLFVESPLCHPSVLMRRDAYASVGGYRDGPFPEDYDLWLRLHAGGWRMAKVPRVLLQWRHANGRLTFRDPRYAPSRFRELKAEHLAQRVQAWEAPVTVWGAGPTGKRLARALEHRGILLRRFVDIDPRKIGGRARCRPVVSPDALRPERDRVVVAVGARGARALIRRDLMGRGFAELQHFICAA